MKTVEQIREELKEIRYYYSRKKFFENSFGRVAPNDVVETVKEYNQIIISAPPRLYDLYISLYTNNVTQESLAAELGYSTQYVQKLNQKLVAFFQAALSVGDAI